jgi:hypothetical protein
MDESSEDPLTDNLSSLSSPSSSSPSPAIVTASSSAAAAASPSSDYYSLDPHQTSAAPPLVFEGRFKGTKETHRLNPNCQQRSAQAIVETPGQGTNDHLSSPAADIPALASMSSMRRRDIPQTIYPRHRPMALSRCILPYSNLMKFLDDATAQSAAPPHSARLSEHRDDVSSISTLSPSLAGGSHSHRQYVWDDDGEHDDAPSPALSKPSVPAPYRRVGAASSSVSSSSHSSSLKTNIEELRLKVERMKSELKVKSQVIKELQSELSRLTSARGEGTLCAGSLISVRQEAGGSASDVDRANQHSEGTEQRGLEETRGLPLEGHSLPPLLPLSPSLSPSPLSALPSPPEHRPTGVGRHSEDQLPKRGVEREAPPPARAAPRAHPRRRVGKSTSAEASVSPAGG